MIRSSSAYSDNDNEKNKSSGPLDDAIKPDRWLYLILSRWRGMMSVSGATKILPNGMPRLASFIFNAAQIRGVFSSGRKQRVSCVSIRLAEPNVSHETGPRDEWSESHLLPARYGPESDESFRQSRFIFVKPFDYECPVPHPARSIKFPRQKRIRSQTNDEVASNKSLGKKKIIAEDN